MKEIILQAIYDLNNKRCDVCGCDITPPITEDDVKEWLEKLVICRVECGVTGCVHAKPHIKEDSCKNGCFEGVCKPIKEVNNGRDKKP